MFREGWQEILDTDHAQNSESCIARSSVFLAEKTFYTDNGIVAWPESDN